VIAHSVIGSGPTLILVDGALCHRGFGPMPDLAKLLASDFRVITYDRRGRGESGMTSGSEIDDIASLVDGEAMLFGSSSGAMLAARAAAELKITKLAMFEPPMMLDGAVPDPPDFREQIDRAIREDRRATR
jgi:pimeloyl-ACP methyl ester carboxylesterase